MRDKTTVSFALLAFNELVFIFQSNMGIDRLRGKLESNYEFGLKSV